MSSSLNPVNQLENMFKGAKNSVSDLMQGKLGASLENSIPFISNGLFGNPNAPHAAPPISPYNFGSPGGGQAQVPGSSSLGFPGNGLPGGFDNPAYGSPSMAGYGMSYYGGAAPIPQGGYYNQMAQMSAGPSYMPTGSSWMQSPIPWLQGAMSGKNFSPNPAGGLPQPAATPQPAVNPTPGQGHPFNPGQGHSFNSGIPGHPYQGMLSHLRMNNLRLR